jgi:hypothetical protein
MRCLLFQAYPWICRKHVQGIEHVFASNTLVPGKRVYPPNNLEMRPFRAWRTLSCLYTIAGRRMSMSLNSSKGECQRSVRSAALHGSNLGLDGVRVLGLLQLPPAN